MKVIENIKTVSNIIDANEWYIKNTIRAKPYNDIIIAQELVGV